MDPEGSGACCVQIVKPGDAVIEQDRPTEADPVTFGVMEAAAFAEEYEAADTLATP